MKNGNIHPKKLLHTHWTKIDPQAKEKHFTVIEVEYDEQQRVVLCVIEAVINNKCYSIDWRALEDRLVWKIGWQ